MDHARLARPPECQEARRSFVEPIAGRAVTEGGASSIALNGKLGERARIPANTRRATKIGTFRAYVQNYLRNHPGVHQDMTIMVRQLQPQPNGLPLEIYCFANTTVWAVYEGIQSDIFDHLFAILPEFDLRVFQNPTGGDFRFRSPEQMAASRHG